jgi:hypothetical protein
LYGVPIVRLWPAKSKWSQKVGVLPDSYMGELDHHKMVVLPDSFFPTLP